MSEKLNIGIIGAGKVAQIAQIPAFERLPDVNILAVADVNLDVANAIAQRHHIPQAYDSHTALLEDSSIDAVVTVLPRPSTGPVSLDCLKAGKHILTEKPMCGSVAQAQVLNEAAEKANRRHIVGYMKRFDAGVEWAKAAMDRLLAEKTLGEIMFVRLHCYQGDDAINAHNPLTAPPPESNGPEWSMAPAWLEEEWHIPYHVYLNRYCHDINLLHHLLPEPLSVVQFRYTDLFSQIALLDMNGVTVTVETGFNQFHGWDEVLEIYFEKGRLILRPPAPFLPFTSAQVELVSAEGVKGGPATESPVIPPSWAFYRQAEAFIETIQSDTPSPNDAVSAFQDLALIEELWKSVERSRPAQETQ